MMAGDSIEIGNVGKDDPMILLKDEIMRLVEERVNPLFVAVEFSGNVTWLWEDPDGSVHFRPEFIFRQTAEPEEEEEEVALVGLSLEGGPDE